jgi:hypothetical protein
VDDTASSLDDDAQIQGDIEKATHACQMASGNVPEPIDSTP